MRSDEELKALGYTEEMLQRRHGYEESKLYTEEQVDKLLQLKPDFILRNEFTDEEIIRIKQFKLIDHEVRGFRPYTCDCIIKFSQPRDDLEDQYTFFKSIKKCELHQHLEGEQHLKVVLIENRALAVLCRALEEQLPEVLDAGKTLSKERFYYDEVVQADGSRRFIFDTTTLSDLQKTTLAALTVETKEGLKVLAEEIVLN